MNSSSTVWLCISHRFFDRGELASGLTWTDEQMGERGAGGIKENGIKYLLNNPKIQVVNITLLILDQKLTLLCIDVVHCCRAKSSYRCSVLRCCSAVCHTFHTRLSHDTQIKSYRFPRINLCLTMSKYKTHPIAVWLWCFKAVSYILCFKRLISTYSSQPSHTTRIRRRVSATHRTTAHVKAKRGSWSNYQISSVMCTTI